MTTKKKKSAKQRRVLIVALIVAAAIVAGSTFAWFASKDEVTNRLTASANYNVAIVEDFQAPADWIPGQTINKDVSAVNAGNVDAFVRMWLGGQMRLLKQVTATDEMVNVSTLNTALAVDAVVDWFGPVDMAHMNKCETCNDEKSPEAALIGGAPADLPDMVRLISPIFYVNESCPRFLVIHGEADTVVPHCVSEFFSNELRKAGRLEEFISVPEGQHGPVTFNEATFKKMTDFFINEAKTH